MIIGITQVALIVRDYEEAKAFYCGKLGFLISEETQLETKKWIRLKAPGNQGAEIVLSKAINETQKVAIGNQAGGRVLFFMQTTDLEADYLRLQNLGIEFTEKPRNEVYGKIAVFRDLYGNRIDLIEPRDFERPKHLQFGHV